MVICVKSVRLLATIFLILLYLRPAECQDVEELATETAISDEANEEDDVVDEHQTTKQSDQEESEDCGGAANSYDELLEEYEDFDDESCSKNVYTHAMVVGSGVLLVLIVCGVACLLKKRGRIDSCVLTSWHSDRQDCCPRRKCKKKGKCKGKCGSCFVYFTKTSPDLSEYCNDDQQIPLPLVCEGKICNNAEMFIQRCMTGSVKRTYSEPVKNIISSKTKFRDYIQELAYSRKKESKECQKHGAVRAFIKEMISLFKKPGSERKIRRKSALDKSSLKRRSSHSSRKVKRRVASSKSDTGVPKSLKRKSSSSSISISSLLLRPKYRMRYKKKVTEPVPNDNRSLIKEPKKDVSVSDFDNQLIIQALIRQGIIQCGDVNMESCNVELEDIDRLDTEELIKICVRKLGQPYNQKLQTIFETQSYWNVPAMRDVAGIVVKEIATSDFRRVKTPLENYNDRYSSTSSTNVVAAGCSTQPIYEDCYWQ